MTTLEGAPQHVEGFFFCVSTPLVSLRGGPRFVGGDFEVEDTPLSSLDGAPKEIGGRFCCFRTEVRLADLLIYVMHAKVGEIVCDYDFLFERFAKASNRERTAMVLEW